MATIDYSPEEKAYMQERDAALKQQVATTPEPKAVTKKTTTVKDTNPSTLATVSDVQDTSAAPVDYGSLVSNVVSGYKDVKEKAPSVLESLDTSMPWLKYAAGTLGVLGAGAVAGGMFKGQEGKKPAPSIKDRSLVRVDPEMDVSRRMPDGRIEPTFGGTDGNRMVGGLFPADVSTKPVAGPTPEVPTVPLNTPVGKAPKEMPMIEQAAGTPEKKAVAEGRKQAAIVPPPSQPSLMTGSGMPAYQGTGPKGTKLSTNIPSLANLPEDKVFVPGGQYMDIIRNATGQEAYTENLKKYGYPVTPQQGYETGRKINESLGRLTREEAKATGAALGEPTKAITEKVNKIKMVKVGGVAGALISLTDLAKADTLRQGLGNVAEGLMPMGIAPSELAPSTLTEKQLSAFREAQKLGSPYRSVPPPR